MANILKSKILYFIVSLLIFVNCKKINDYSTTPSIEFVNSEVKTGTDLLGNKSYKVTLQFYLIDGDGNVGLPNNAGKPYVGDSAFNFFSQLFFLKNKQYNKAIKHLNTALFYITSPSKSDMHLQLAKAYGMIREFAKSIEQYKKSYELNPKNNILYEIATTYEELDPDRQKALEFYTKYIQNATQKESKRCEYAKSRILHIKEKIHWEK